MANKFKADNTRGGTGLILGKFMPPHRGHLFLVDFARQYVDHLTVLVCSIEREPIPGKLRYQWMRQLCHGAEVVHVTDELPQEPSEHPDFWQLWHDRIRQSLPVGPDYVFASEDYGWKLAEVLGAQYVPVDHARQVVPISGTLMRQDPMRHWDLLPECVRPYYLKRICVFGPESTGKSTLAAQLAQHYKTVYAWEYARPLLDFKNGIAEPDDIPKIVRGQIATEEALAPKANRMLFCDTDVLTTTIWGEVLFGSCPDWVREEANRRYYDLYLLLDIDVPWVDDNQRFFRSTEERRAFFDLCKRTLDENQREYVIIRGDWDKRLSQAIDAVDRLITGESDSIAEH